MIESEQPLSCAGSLADFTRKQLILPLLRDRDVAGVVQELSLLLKQEELIPDLLPFYNAVLNREFLTSTSFGAGLAIPHARVTGLDRLWFALGRVADPIPWGAKDAPPVQLIFLIAIPGTEAAAYLNFVSGLARLGKDPALIQKLKSAENASVIWELLRGVRLRKAPSSLPLASAGEPVLNWPTP